jgi:hypothetical protein
MLPISLIPSRFAPTTGLTGAEPVNIFRGKNCRLRGDLDVPRFEVYAGSKDLGEAYDLLTETLTGTISTATGSQIVTGAGTNFVTELRPGQMIITSGGEPLVVKRIESNETFFTERPVSAGETAVQGRFMPVLFEIDKTRGSLRRGNAIKGDKNDILLVGSGFFRRNGAFTGFFATRRPKRLEYQPNGGYIEFPFGFETVPPVPVVTIGTGGSKGMMAGKYSFMISYWNSVTDGFSNPSAVLKKDAANADITIAAGGKFSFSFSAAVAAKPANADGFIIWGNLSGGGVPATNQTNFDNGPWYRAAKVKISALGGGDTYDLEYLDAEVGAVASGDNNAPPECEFVAEFANNVFFISCLGKKTETNALGTSPGNYVIPAKGSNKEAAPYDWRVSLEDEITGFASGIGRLFCLTTKGVPFVTPTGRTELARLVPTLQDIPFTSRPFWTKGGISPYNITVVQSDVFAFTGGKPLRSPSGADENQIPFNLGAPVEDLLKGVADGYVFVKHDPKNQQVCYILSATRKNAQGYWISEILPFDLQTNSWQPVIEISSPIRDMIVCGADTIDNRLEFLAGGRFPLANGFFVSTFRYDEPAGVPVPYYFAIQPTDNGADGRSKQIRAIRATGRMSSPIVQIHGAQANGDISISDIENGTNSLSGNIALSSSANIQHQLEKNYLVKNLQLWSLRFSGVWSGAGEPDRVEELVVQVEVHGKRQ